ncbi:MAG: endolytic transglycosylase MltG [Butyrivibrio sp.]|uniref:endolytic transglycosylase MltG n=1 Tax=Butyrivibrio sp. TaxID=28121 RepID=UPI0025C0D047|nr:endolytic transglycosylase MltG [Butyrivibrio sp.]MBQ6589151.1 endolytic transglycosylase MltG [Butyrivibrio sp.]
MSVRKFVLGLLDAAVKIAFVIIVVMLISRYSKMAYEYGYHIFNQVPVSSGTGRAVTVTISEGDSASTIADKLASVGLITDKNLFKLQEKFSDYHGLETPGTYELSTAMTPEEMLQIMAAGSIGTTEVSSQASEESSEETEGAETEAQEETNGG